jgi:hypothetical protein
MRADQNLARSRIMRARIVSHIEQNGPATNAELQFALGRSPSTIIHHTSILAREDAIHNEPAYNHKNGKDEFVWHLGQGIGPIKSNVRQRKIKKWPLHHVRDSLVAALFGTTKYCEVRV